eukprot:CAMPEP_0171293272 /NCGR_PEP_ID=MMETSP0816-20121228/1461_1 /TAXON_ID=420281 /ORGANISM="Proboscia inermis, Strain CCAP1064/1" /LENGTH=222 /DNA_ID=CAMNT_0011763937 /DNA_START=165 /DNA_END=829 /DNA_ORIENTATION=-
MKTITKRAKVVPTVYKNAKGADRETNRFFFTERFRPLYTELEDEHYDLGEKKKFLDNIAADTDDDGEHFDDDDELDVDDFNDDDDDDDDDDDEDHDGKGIHVKLKEKLNEQKKEEKKEEKKKEKEVKRKLKSEKVEKRKDNAKKKHAGAKIGGAHGGSHDHKDHHKVQNALIPGVFFIYEVYPFAVEISHNSVPLTHLILRIMAVIGGVVTITGWVDKFLYA